MKAFLVLFVVIGLSYSTAYASVSFTPPDTVTSLADRSAAMLMLEEGKKVFNEGKVREALLNFRQAAQKDPNTWRAPLWISFCHFKMDNYGYAIQYANEAIQLKNEDPDVYEVLAKSYHRTNQLDSALKYYEIAKVKMLPKRQTDVMLKENHAACLYAKEVYKNEVVEIRTLSKGQVNSGFPDYAPILVNGGKTMYFTSRRNNTTGGMNNPDDEMYFEDIYIAQWNEESERWDSISNDLGRINTDGFESFSFISRDGKKAIITHNRMDVTNGSDICEVDFTDKNRWGTPKLIKNKTINTSFFDGVATLTADGNTMYFVSDRNGKKKGTDIYVVNRVGKQWGEAKPVSDSINSNYDETTPYITPDGRYLFFSSQGHLGMGGYDIYVSENLGTTWSKPVNLGPAFNTVNDDTHFQYYPELKKAVMVCFVVEGQKSSRDIFEIDMLNFKFPKK